MEPPSVQMHFSLPSHDDISPVATDTHWSCFFSFSYLGEARETASSVRLETDDHSCHGKRKWPNLRLHLNLHSVHRARK